MQISPATKHQIKPEHKEQLELILEEIYDIECWEKKSIRKFLKWALGSVSEIIDRRGLVFLGEVAREFMRRNKVDDLIEILGKRGIECSLSTHVDDAFLETNNFSTGDNSHVL